MDLIRCLGVVSLAGVALIACASSTSATGPGGVAQGAPIAPNQSIVVAEVTRAVIVDAAALGMQPPQPLSELSLRVESVKATQDDPALRGDERTIIVLSRDTDLVKLKGARVTATVTRRGDERGTRLWATSVIALPPK